MNMEQAEICKKIGHDFETYTHWYENATSSTDCEQAGHCNRCGFDTHEQDAEAWNTRTPTERGEGECDFAK